MSSNYGYDANGWEREQFPARDEFAEPKQWASTAHAVAMVAHTDCAECRSGKGYIKPGPPHCAEHDKHCTAAPCW